MAWTRANFDMVAPELSGVSSDVYTYFAALAEEQLPTTLSGATATQAGALLTAHFVAMSPPSGVSPAGAPMTSASAGGTSVSYAIGSFGPSTYALTRYGVAYMALIRYLAIGGFVA